MDRTEFMSIVYDELQSESDNNRANRIIDAADEYAESMEPRWIPVIERLPVEGESVLLCNSYGDMTLGRLVRTNEGCNWDIYAWWCDIYDWVAWMPLPEPYREEEVTG